MFEVVVQLTLLNWLIARRRYSVEVLTAVGLYIGLVADNMLLNVPPNGLLCHWNVSVAPSPARRAVGVEILVNALGISPTQTV